MIYLANSFPNCWVIREPKITSISAETASTIVSEANYYADYDDNIPPRTLRSDTISLVGHDSTAQYFGQLLSDATLAGKPLPLEIPVSREDPIPQPGDKVVCGLFVPPRRLNEGEKWQESDFLSNTHWILLEF